jgi:hypothetical protein
MTQQTIFVGSLPNDGTGDTLRGAMIKTNANFTELYDLHDGAGDNFTVPYGDIGPISATNTSQFTHNGEPVEFTLTTTSDTYQQIQIRLSAPSVLLSGAQGPVVIQRVVDGVGTDIHAIIVSSIDNGYHMVYEDTHGQPVGTAITYKLFNRTGSGGTGGTVQFVTTYGFQFGGREV